MGLEQNSIVYLTLNYETVYMLEDINTTKSSQMNNVMYHQFKVIHVFLK